jgi:hypothetical protein
VGNSLFVIDLAFQAEESGFCRRFSPGGVGHGRWEAEATKKPWFVRAYHSLNLRGQMNQPKQSVPDKRPWTIAQAVRQRVQADDVIYGTMASGGGNLTRPFCTGQLRGILPITAQVGYRSCDGHHINFRRSDTTLRPNALILEAEPSEPGPHFCKEKHKQKYCIASHDLSPKVRPLTRRPTPRPIRIRCIFCFCPMAAEKSLRVPGCMAPCAVST